MVQGPGGVGAVPGTMMDLPEEDTGQPLRIEKRALVAGENLVDAQQDRKSVV